ncbi:MAG: hypothetical protein AB8B74_02370 [Crocinitomicaceae bacterium]
MNKSILILLVLFFVISCKTESNYEHLDNYIKLKKEDISLADFNSVIVVSEAGTCPFCTDHFTKAISNHINNQNILFLVTTRGMNVDISSFIKTTRNNIVIDYSNDFSKLNLAKGCAIIELKEQQIDTIIQIQPENLQPSIDLFENH